MSAISCAVNFKENFTKNIPYYKLLLKQINDAQALSFKDGSIICEHIGITCKKTENIISKICEGYQFIIAFDGELKAVETLKSELKALGYCFTADNDAELTLNAYIHFGEKAPEKLVGRFAFIIYDTMRRQFFAASDAFSSIPIFYTKLDDLYIFTSQIRGLFAHPDVLPKISHRGISRLLSFSRGYTDIFENINILPPSHILKIKGDDFMVKKYSPKASNDTSFSENIVPLCENPSVIHLGTKNDDLLFSQVAKNSLENHTRTSAYSFTKSDIFKKYSAQHFIVPLDDNLILTALENCISVFGIPTLSVSDFLLDIIFRRIPKSSDNVFTSLPDLSLQKSSNQYILEKNNAFHMPVKDTLLKEDIEQNITLNTPHLLSEEYEIDLKSPFLSQAVQSSDICKEIHDNFDMKISGLTGRLKRILIEIIADDTAPILAFFEKSALLKLCERGFDLSGSDLTETELISYIIKLNLWFLKYRPTIV